MRVDLFDFELPTELIAQQPAVPRESARLLHIGAKNRDLHIKNLPLLLETGDVMVVNNTKVIPCRITGQRHQNMRSNGHARHAKIEVTLHKQILPDTWLAFARPARKLRSGDIITFAPELQATVVDKLCGGEVVLHFDYTGPELLKTLETNGIMPLPPYIKRGEEDHANDQKNYQTVFASELGAAAAPTAGLHFTPELIQKIIERGIEIVQITLHVGAGTFLPVKVRDTNEHVMHGEWADLSLAACNTINRAHNRGKRVLAVGSTSLRLLESATREDGVVRAFSGDTDLFIVPGHRFKVVDLVLTNFHLPRSTLFMLVSAFAGLERMQTAYAHAIKAGYRFFSYGDACLLEPNHETWGN